VHRPGPVFFLKNLLSCRPQCIFGAPEIARCISSSKLQGLCIGLYNIYGINAQSLILKTIAVYTYDQCRDCRLYTGTLAMYIHGLLVFQCLNTVGWALYIACKIVPEMTYQWRRLYRARGHIPLTFTNGWARGGTVSGRTANNKTDICTDHHESAHQND